MAQGDELGAGYGDDMPGRSASRVPGMGLGGILARAGLVGAIGSIVIHFWLLLVAALVTVTLARSGSAGGGDAPVDLAVLTESELAAVLDQPLPEGGSSVVADGSPGDIPAVELEMAPGGGDLPGAGLSAGDLGVDLGGTGGGVGDGGGLGGGAGVGSTSFFGVEARGARFLYVIDISGSMQGAKLAALKDELSGSINTLPDQTAFYVVFFESDAVPMNQSGRWMDATAANKRWVASRIAEVEARGGTNPAPAFSAAFAMRPRPDAIYFMSDGLFDEEVAGQVAAANRGSRKVPVHCIAYGDDAATELLQRIAEESGGTYAEIARRRR